MAERSVVNFRKGCCNSRGDGTLLGFVERNNLRLISTFFRKRSNGTTRNEIDVNLSNNPGVVQDIEVLSN